MSEMISSEANGGSNEAAAVGGADDAVGSDSSPQMLDLTSPDVWDDRAIKAFDRAMKIAERDEESSKRSEHKKGKKKKTKSHSADSVKEGGPKTPKVVSCHLQEQRFPHPRLLRQGAAPHPLMPNASGNASDPLTNMLLAWYWSGYYTSRYQAQQEYMKQQNSSK